MFSVFPVHDRRSTHGGENSHECGRDGEVWIRHLVILFFVVVLVCFYEGLDEPEAFSFRLCRSLFTKIVSLSSFDPVVSPLVCLNVLFPHVAAFFGGSGDDRH